MGIEIERKFLVDPHKWKQLNKPEGVPYKQGYMVKEPSKTVRIRIAGVKAFITIKGKSLGASRSEYEYAIPLNDANELLAEFCGSEVSKIRYKIPFNGNLWEVDEFTGKNSGLIIAEIELNSEDVLFDMPEWVGVEVTGDERYYNSNLSVQPLPFY